MTKTFLKNFSDTAKGKLCSEIGAVKLLQNGVDKFTVQYGLQVTSDLDYGQAAAEFGSCIMHELACDSLLDNRMKGEK